MSWDLGGATSVVRRQLKSGGSGVEKTRRFRQENCQGLSFCLRPNVEVIVSFHLRHQVLLGRGSVIRDQVEQESGIDDQSTGPLWEVDHNPRVNLLNETQTKSSKLDGFDLALC